MDERACTAKRAKKQPPAGIEPATTRLEVWRAVQLRHGGEFVGRKTRTHFLVQTLMGAVRDVTVHCRFIAFQPDDRAVPPSASSSSHRTETGRHAGVGIDMGLYGVLPIQF